MVLNLTDPKQFRGDIKEIDASAYEGETTLIGGDDENVLKAGSGNAYLDGGAGSNTLVGGAGSDTFKVGAGNDLIKDFDPASDVITTGDKAITSAKAEGNDLILTTPDGTVTIEGAADKAFKFYNDYTTDVTGSVDMSSVPANVVIIP